MRAAAYDGSGHFDIVEREATEPGPGQVRVRIEACGICGTDLHYVRHGLLRSGQTPGHEMAGRIDRLGPDVSGLAIDQPVAVEPLESCGRCPDCAAGRDSICRAVRIAGIHGAGGLAQSIVVPAARVYPLAAGIDPAVAAMTEPVAVAVHGLDRGGFEPGQRVLVLGAGPVGLVTLIAAKSLGAGEVFVTARHAAQAGTARTLGADRVLEERAATAADLDRLGRATDIDLAVETVGGRADTLATAAAAVRPGGRISVLGLFMASPPLAPIPLLLKELTVGWSNCYHHPPGRAADFERAAVIVDRERERLARLVTDRLSLDAVDRAFARAGDKAGGAMKVSVLPT